MAEQEGIPRSINLAKPDHVWGLSYRDLKTHFELNGYETLPPKDSAQNNSDSVLKYRGNLVGDINPSLPDPPAGDGGCSGGNILMMAIAIAVTIATQGAAASLLGSHLAGTVAAAAAGNLAGQIVGNAVGVQDGIDFGDVLVSAAGAYIGANFFPTPLAQGDLIGMASRSAVGNIASQGLNIVVGRQDNFNWKSVVASAIAAPIASSISNGV